MVAVTALVLALVGNDTRVIHAAVGPVAPAVDSCVGGSRTKSRVGHRGFRGVVPPHAGLSLPHYFRQFVGKAKAVDVDY